MGIGYCLLSAIKKETDLFSENKFVPFLLYVVVFDRLIVEPFAVGESARHGTKRSG